MKIRILLGSVWALAAAAALFFLGTTPSLEPRDTLGLQRHRSAEGNIFEQAQQSTVLVESDEGYGTGVVILRGKHTFVLTAKHVIAGHGGTKINVMYHPFGFKSGGASYHTEIVLLSEQADAAVLEVVPNPGTLRGAEFEFAMPRVGDPLFHVGNFLGPDFDGTVSTGIISQVGVYPARLESIWPWALSDSSTAFNMRGCSGGGLFTPAGKILGIAVGNKDEIVFIHLPTRVLLAAAQAEGWAWLFDPAATLPTDETLARMEAYNCPATGPAEPEPAITTMSIEQFIKLFGGSLQSQPAQTPTKNINPGRRTP